MCLARGCAEKKKGGGGRRSHLHSEYERLTQKMRRQIKHSRKWCAGQDARLFTMNTRDVQGKEKRRWSATLSRVFAPYVYNVRVVGANSSKRYASEPESDKYTRCKTPGIARKSSGCAFAILHTLIPFRCLERFIISVRALAHRKPSLGMYTARQCALSNAEHFFFFYLHIAATSFRAFSTHNERHGCRP